MLHSPGIYFGMTAEEYHADPALGSSSIRDLIASPRRYWERSWMNPDRDLYVDDEDTDATQLGTALHCYVLDGQAAFSRNYIRRPDDDPGATPSQKAALTRKANEAAKAVNRISLHGDEWRLCEKAAAVISEHVDLEDLFVGGDHEVSIFWRNQFEIPCKARFDILKPRGIADVKTIAIRDHGRLDVAAKYAIKRLRYHIQAEHYLEARRQLPALFKAEKVFACVAGTSQGPAPAPIIERLKICAQHKKSSFVLVFLSKATPECWGCILSPGNPILEEARARIDGAFENYHRLRADYGTKPWPQEWRLEELDINEMPGGEFGWN